MKNSLKNTLNTAKENIKKHSSKLIASAALISALSACHSEKTQNTSTETTDSIKTEQVIAKPAENIEKISTNINANQPTTNTEEVELDAETMKLIEEMTNEENNTPEQQAPRREQLGFEDEKAFISANKLLEKIEGDLTQFINTPDFAWSDPGVIEACEGVLKNYKKVADMLQKPYSKKAKQLEQLIKKAKQK